MRKLVLAPDQSGYAVEYGTGVISTRLEGGKSKVRRDMLNPIDRVNVKWATNREGFDYLSAFNRIYEKEVTPFQIELYIGQSTLTTHLATIVPGSFQLTSQQGLEFVVSAQLEVVANDYAMANDEMILTLFETYEDVGGVVFNQLATLVNVTLPQRFR